MNTFVRNLVSTPIWQKVDSVALLALVEAGGSLAEIAVRFDRRMRDVRNRWFHLWNTGQTDRRPPRQSVVFADDAK